MISSHKQESRQNYSLLHSIPTCTLFFKPNYIVARGKKEKTTFRLATDCDTCLVSTLYVLTICRQISHTWYYFIQTTTAKLGATRIAPIQSSHKLNLIMSSIIYFTSVSVIWPVYCITVSSVKPQQAAVKFHYWT